LKNTIFCESDQLYSVKILNKYNGVTRRRWIYFCNPKLSELISDVMSGIDEWITSLENFESLKAYATDKNLLDKFI